MTIRNLAISLALVPGIASADTESYSAGYRIGWLVGSFIDSYGVYLRAAALIGIVGWLWFRRSRARKPRNDN
jgi:hypothetical protein